MWDTELSTQLLHTVWDSWDMCEFWGVIVSLCTQNWNSSDVLVSQVHEDASRDEYKSGETAEITRWRHFL